MSRVFYNVTDVKNFKGCPYLMILVFVSAPGERPYAIPQTTECADSLGLPEIQRGELSLRPYRGRAYRQGEGAAPPPQC